MRKDAIKRAGGAQSGQESTVPWGACASTRGRRAYFFADPNGFTLLEIMIVVVIIGITAAIAIPSIRALIPRYHIKGATRELVEAMQLGRMRAISTGNIFYIDFDHQGGGVDGRYYVCYLDTDGDGTATAAEVSASQIIPNHHVGGMAVVRLPRSVSYGADGSTTAPNSDAIGNGVAVNVGGSKRIAFFPDGRTNLNDTAGSQPTIYLQTSRGGHNRAIQVNVLGRVRVLKWGDGEWG